MANLEIRNSLLDRTVKSEPFENFAKKPLTIAGASFLLALGLGSVEGVIEAIDNEMANVAFAYGIQAGIELTAAGSVAYANVNHIVKRNRNKNRIRQ